MHPPPATYSGPRPSATRNALCSARSRAAGPARACGRSTSESAHHVFERLPLAVPDSCDAVDCALRSPAYWTARAPVSNAIPPQLACGRGPGWAELGTSQGTSGKIKLQD